MGSYSKSPKKVLQASYVIGKATFEDYSHPSSPHKYTQPQIFSCLVLKTFLNLDYRGLMQFLNDCPDLCSTIDMYEVPHYTTFQKASRRLLKLPKAREALSVTLKKQSKKKE